MKKRILMFVSMLTALMMSFSFIGCGSDNESKANGGNNKPSGGGNNTAQVVTMLGNALGSIDTLMTADGFKGTYAYSLDSDKAATAKTGNGSVERRYDTVKVTYDANGEAYYNTDSGYVYIKDGASYVASCYPSVKEILDYIEYIMPESDDEKVDGGVLLSAAAALPGDIAAPAPDIASVALLAQYFSYDASAKKLVGQIDISETVNDWLDPLYRNKKGNLYGLIDSYIKQATNQKTSLDDVLTTVAALAKSNVDTPIAELLEMIDDMLGVSVLDVLDNFYQLSDAQLAALETRTVGEAVAALDKFIKSFASSDSGSNIDLSGFMNMTSAQIKELADNAVNAALLGDVSDVDNVEDLIDGIKFAVAGLLTATRASVVLDKITNPNLRFMIDKTVYFNEVSCTLTFTFGSDNAVTKYEVSGKIAHSYSKATGAEGTLFENNNYVCDAALDVTELLTAPTAFSITANSLDGIYKTVYGDLTDGAELALGTAGKALNVSGAMYFNAQKQPVNVTNKNGLSYAQATGKLTLSAALAAELKAAAGELRAITVVLPADADTVSVTVVFLPDSADELLSYGKTLGEALAEAKKLPSAKN